MHSPHRRFKVMIKLKISFCLTHSPHRRFKVMNPLASQVRWKQKRKKRIRWAARSKGLKDLKKLPGAGKETQRVR
jgi:hypothetical protein